VASDTGIEGSGRVGIRSTNTGSTSRPVVSVDDFRVQSVGMTVHLFVRPDQLDFSPGYIHWLGKGTKGQQEWGFRLYAESDARPNRISAYVWNRGGDLGAGAYFQDKLEAGRYLQIVAVFDPGDALDPSAGVTIYRDGVRRKGPPSGGTLYSHPDYRVMPGNGTAPLRFGTRDLAGFLSGAIDEVAIFDRKLSDAEINQLHAASK
jgi:hypothetical protein